MGSHWVVLLALIFVGVGGFFGWMHREETIAAASAPIPVRTVRLPDEPGTKKPTLVTAATNPTPTPAPISAPPVAMQPAPATVTPQPPALVMPNPVPAPAVVQAQPAVPNPAGMNPAAPAAPAVIRRPMPARTPEERAKVFTDLQDLIKTKMRLESTDLGNGGFAFQMHGCRLEVKPENLINWSISLFNVNPANPDLESDTFKACHETLMGTLEVDMQLQYSQAANGTKTLRTFSKLGRVLLTRDPMKGNALDIRPIIQPNVRNNPPGALTPGAPAAPAGPVVPVAPPAPPGAAVAPAPAAPAHTPAPAPAPVQRIEKTIKPATKTPGVDAATEQF